MVQNLTSSMSKFNYGDISLPKQSSEIFSLFSFNSPTTPIFGGNFAPTSFGFGFNNFSAPLPSMDFKSFSFASIFQSLSTRMQSFWPGNFFGNVGSSIKSKATTALKSLKGVYNSVVGERLARIAERNANRTNTGRWCASGVNKSLQLAGLTRGETIAPSAYQVADKLANRKNFKEVAVARKDLKELRAGCIIVWDRSYGHPHGHIGITLGDGREASDKVRDNLIMRDRYRVFVPTGSKNMIG